MTKSRRSSRSSASSVRNLLLLLVTATAFFAGCTTSTAPSYKISDLEGTISKILKEEYRTDSRVVLTGGTLWIYLPIEKLFEKTAGDDPADKVKERFELQANDTILKDGLLSVSYLAKPIVPEREKDQGYKLNKDAIKKINDAWEVIRRMIFSMDRTEREQVRFYVLMAADISNGIELRETIYYQDMIKVMYRLISPGEYHHRVPVKSGLKPEIVGNTSGQNLQFDDIAFEDFICRQIEHRVGLKFQKPEIEATADFDKEIEKAVLDTLRIYKFSDFRVAELTNLMTNGRIHLDPEDVRNLKPVR